MNMQIKTLITVGERSVWATAVQAETLATLTESRKGGFARVYGYIATSGRTVPTVYDAVVTTRFRYSRMIERKRDILDGLTLADVTIKEPKLLALDTSELTKTFEDRKAQEIASIDKTMAGDRTDTNRQAHDRCYLKVSDGVIVHFDTAKGDDGLKQPVLTDGFPTVESVMLDVLEISRTVREPGVRKQVNSGVSVLMGNAITDAVKRKGVRSLSRMSLKPESFERLVIDRNTIIPNDFIGLID